MAMRIDGPGLAVALGLVVLASIVAAWLMPENVPLLLEDVAALIIEPPAAGSDRQSDGDDG